MTRSFARLFLVLLVPALAACDSTEVNPPAVDPIVGTWLMTDLTSAGYIVPNREVTFPDFLQPVRGSVTVVGDSLAGGVSYELPYVRNLYGPPDRPPETVTLQSHPSDDLYSLARWAHLTLSMSRYQSSQLTIGEVGSSIGYYIYAPSLSLSATGIDVPTFTVQGSYDPQASAYATYTVGGAISFAMRTLPPDTEAEVAPWVGYSFDEVREYRVVFEDDGTYRSETTYGNQTMSLEGQWVANDGRLRVSIENQNWTGLPVTVEYAYTVEGGSLLLAAELDPCPRGCVRSVEQRLRLPVESLRSARSEARYRYTPSESRWLPPAEPSDLTPEEVRARLLPGTEVAPVR